MKNPRIVEAMGNIDDKLISEAATYKPQKKKTPIWTKWVAAAACLCFCFLGAIKIWNPGMGCSQQLRDFVEENGTLYFSTWEDGVYGWNPDMDKPQKLSDTGRVAKTNIGTILYSMEQQKLWEISEFERRELGSFDAEGLCAELDFDEPDLIGVYDGSAYWVGEHQNLVEDKTDSKIIETPLHGGNIEAVPMVSEGSILAAYIREDGLYYHINEFGTYKNKIGVFHLTENQDSILAEFETADTGLSLEVHFMEDSILISDRETESLYRMAYTGGEPVYLTNAVPITNGFSERDGKVYYQTSFGDNESIEFLEGLTDYSENLVSVDLATGKLTKIEDFALDNGDGTVQYTLTELAMTDGGFYFADPHDGVLYHDDIANTETEVYRSK